MATAIDLVDAIRDEASTTYAERIPEAVRVGIAAVGNALLEYTAAKEEFLDILVNKIALTIVDSKMATNPLSRFNRGNVPFGDTIEEIFVDIASGFEFDATITDQFGKVLPDVKVIYHRQDRKMKYKVTVSDAQLKSAFRSQEGLTALTTAIVNSLYSGMAYDEFTFTKELLATYEGYKQVVVDEIVDEATAKNFLLELKKASSDMTFMNSIYNKAGVMTSTPKANQVLLLHKDVKNVLDVAVLANIFNLSTANLETQIIEVDDFGSKENCYAMLMDEDIFRIYDTLRTTETARNGESLYTNYFVHLWSIYSLSTFKQLAIFEHSIVQN